MADDSKNIYQRLVDVQSKLVAPRAISGRFGMARSAEQILEAAKPVCREYGLYLYTTDEVQEIGGRNYCITTARVVNMHDPSQVVEATASAWENEVSGGLDTSQVSGKTSSYAKKYALQNLLAIDDTKDADFEHDEPAQTVTRTAAPRKAAVKQVHDPDAPASDKQKQLISDKLSELGVTLEDQRGYIIEQYGVTIPLTKEGASAVLDDLVGN